MHHHLLKYCSTVPVHQLAKHKFITWCQDISRMSNKTCNAVTSVKNPWWLSDSYLIADLCDKPTVVLAVFGHALPWLLRLIFWLPQSNIISLTGRQLQLNERCNMISQDRCYGKTKDLFLIEVFANYKRSNYFSTNVSWFMKFLCWSCNQGVFEWHLPVVL